MFRKILVANDGSKAAAKALEVALDLAKRWRAEIHMISVEELPYFPGTREEVIGEKALENKKFAKIIKKARKLAVEKRLKLNAHVVVGHPVKAVSGFAKKKKIDLLVIGSTGHSHVYNLLVGSMADRAIKASPCSILIVK